MFYKLRGATKDYIWGGRRLAAYGYPGERVAEAWVLSFHPDGLSETRGKPVTEVLTRETWGSGCGKFSMFPTLIKLIDAKENLSVQVHPSDAYALEREGQYGKTEMWYVLDAEPGAGLYVGFARDLTAREFSERIESNTLMEALNFVAVKPGDSFFIEAGTVHAIGKGCLIAEVQQNSNLTYRVYDYGRVGADGKPRALHIDKALAVSRLERFTPKRFDGALAECPYFRARLVSAGSVGEADSFTSVVFLSDGRIGGESAKKGDSFFIPAGERVKVDGSALVTTVPT